MKINKILKIVFITLGFALMVQTCSADALTDYIGRTSKINNEQDFNDFARRISYYDNLDTIIDHQATKGWVKASTSKNNWLHNTVYEQIALLFTLECDRNESGFAVRENKEWVGINYWTKENFNWVLIWNSLALAREIEAGNYVLEDGKDVVETTCNEMIRLSEEGNTVHKYHERKKMLEDAIADARIYIKDLGLEELATELNAIEGGISKSEKDQKLIAPRVIGWFDGTNGELRIDDEKTVIIAEKKPILDEITAGIKNIGNTCYLNATLQALSKSQILRKFLAEVPNDEGDLFCVCELLSDYFKDINAKTVSEAKTRMLIKSLVNQFKLHEIFDDKVIAELNTKSKEIKKEGEELKRDLSDQEEGKIYGETAQNFSKEVEDAGGIEAYLGQLNREYNNITTSLNNIFLKGYATQQDAGELIDRMLNCIKTESIMKGQQAEFNRLFLTTTQTILSCECKKTSTKEEYSLILQLPIKSTLKNCLESIEGEEELSEENRWKCETKDCKLKTKKTHSIIQAPEVLILQLKRFTNNVEKIDEEVGYEQQLKYHGNTYRLVSIIEHSGSLTGGHYWADVLGADGNWWVANDSSVTKLETLANNDKKDYKYIFIYEKVGDNGAEQQQEVQESMPEEQNSDRLIEEKKEEEQQQDQEAENPEEQKEPDTKE